MSIFCTIVRLKEHWKLFQCSIIQNQFMFEVIIIQHIYPQYSVRCQIAKAVYKKNSKFHQIFTQMQSLILSTTWLPLGGKKRPVELGRLVICLNRLGVERIRDKHRGIHHVVHMESKTRSHDRNNYKYKHESRASKNSSRVRKCGLCPTAVNAYNSITEG